jgi:uncharacterized protein
MTDENLDLRILGVDPGDEIAGARKLTLRTNRGAIPIVMHAAESASRAVACISGAIGGFDGPAMLYPRLGLELPRKGIAVARVNYRAPNDFDECLLDTLAALTFLKGTGHRRAAIIGHSFGGAVAINAGTLSPVAAAVIAISSQLAGAHVVADLRAQAAPADSWDRGRYPAAAQFRANLRARGRAEAPDVVRGRRPSLQR